MSLLSGYGNLSPNLRLHIVTDLQCLLYQHNPFIRDLKTVIERQDMRKLQVISFMPTESTVCIPTTDERSNN